jgi:hypothetical protein
VAQRVESREPMPIGESIHSTPGPKGSGTKTAVGTLLSSSIVSPLPPPSIIKSFPSSAAFVPRTTLSVGSPYGVGLIHHQIAVVLEYEKRSRPARCARGPNRLVILIIKNKITVGLHNTFLNSPTGCVAGPQRMSAPVENEIAVALEDESVSLVF